MAAHWTLTIPQHPPRGASPLATLRRWYARTRQRQALTELDDRLLRDCGITPEQVRREISKPFWLA